MVAPASYLLVFANENGALEFHANGFHVDEQKIEEMLFSGDFYMHIYIPRSLEVIEGLNIRI